MEKKPVITIQVAREAAYAASEVVELHSTAVFGEQERELLALAIYRLAAGDEQLEEELSSPVFWVEEGDIHGSV